VYPLLFGQGAIHFYIGGFMYVETPRVGHMGRMRNLMFAVIALGIALGLVMTTLPIHAEVTMVSQNREVTTFAMINLVGEENPFCSDGRDSREPGVFAETVECRVEEGGSQATGSAGQLSYILPTLLLAEGSIDAHADISDGADFAEGLGASRCVSEFSVDTIAEIRLRATLHANGNGSTNLVFRVTNGEIFVLRTIQESSDEVDEWFTLDPGSYELTLATSGYGQALPEGGGNPAFGSFSGSIEFPTASVSTPGAAERRLAPVAAPNPVRHRTTLFASHGGSVQNGEIIIVDLGGRLIRRFDNVGPTGVSWDSRDKDGRPVAAGIYLLRGGSGATNRLVVLR
jgi:hypothetical protein